MCRAVDRLSHLCVALNLSTPDFADRLDLPLRRANRVLKPTRDPSLKLMARVLGAFPEVSPRWLLTGQGQMFLPEPPFTPTGNSIGTSYGTVHQNIYHYHFNDLPVGPCLS